MDSMLPRSWRTFSQFGQPSRTNFCSRWGQLPLDKGLIGVERSSHRLHLNHRANHAGAQMALLVGSSVEGHLAKAWRREKDKDEVRAVSRVLESCQGPLPSEKKRCQEPKEVTFNFGFLSSPLTVACAILEERIPFFGSSLLLLPSFAPRAHIAFRSLSRAPRLRPCLRTKRPPTPLSCRATKHSLNMSGLRR